MPSSFRLWQDKEPGGRVSHGPRGNCSFKGDIESMIWVLKRYWVREADFSSIPFLVSIRLSSSPEVIQERLPVIKICFY